MASREAVLTAILKDGISGPAKKIQGEMGKLGKVSGALHGVAGKLTGGLSSLVGSVFSLQGALVGGGLVAAITAMSKAAADDAASTAKLETAIKANAKATGDYKKTVDAAIAAGQKLAFTDDQTRASLSRLVVSTKDVGEATKLNNLAMDLARLKGIELADAANIVGKVHDGNVGILGRYGISVKEGATATEALAAIQQAAAGQAQAFGESSAGSFAKMQDSIGEASEALGYIFLPIVTEIANFLTTAVVPAIAGVIESIQSWVTSNQPIIDQIRTFVSGALSDLTTFVTSKVIPAVTQIAGKMAAFGMKVAQDVGPAIVAVGQKLAELVNLVVTKVVPVIMDFAQRVWEGGANRVFAAFYKIAGSVIDILIGLFTTITENEDAMNILRTAGDLIGKAFGIVADVLESTVDFLGDLGSAITSNKPLMDILAAAGRAIAAAFKAAGDAIGAVIGFIRTVIDVAQTAIGLLAQLAGAQAASAKPAAPKPRRAAGGSVAPGGTYLVGERGPELLHMGTAGGYIQPNIGTGGRQLAPVSIPVVIDGREVARIVDEHLFYDYRVGARGVVGV